MTDEEIQLGPLDAVVVAEAWVDLDETTGFFGSVMSEHFDGLFTALDLAGLGSNTPIARYTARPDGLEGVRVHAGVVVEPGTAAADGFEIVTLPAEPLAVTLLHRGSLVTLEDAWVQLTGWVLGRADLKEASTESRELHVRAPAEDASTESWVTELQLPVTWVDARPHPVDPNH